MKIQVNLLLLLLAAGLMIVAGSCREEKTGNDPDELKASVQPYVNILNSFNIAAAEEVSGEEDLKSAGNDVCLVVTVNDNGTGEFWPMSWTLDYGSTDCEIIPGIRQRGKIHVSLSNWWLQEGAVREITFENYFFNDIGLDGTKSILNDGLNQDGNLQLVQNVSDGKLTYLNGLFITWNCTHTSEMIEGGDTFVLADNVWSVTGSGSGKTPAGKDYSITITSPLLYKHDCFHPVSGQIEITVEGEMLRAVSYGNGACDNFAEVTIGENSGQIEL